MDAKAKRRIELDRQIEARKENIIDSAIQEFIENGIDNSKISDIAKRAEVGAATVYRYFETKPKLVVECATKLWHSEMSSLTPLFYPANYNELNGFEKVRQILNTIGSLYKIRPHLLRLLEQFDNYIVRERISKEFLQKYEAGIIDTRVMMLAAVEAGQEDGSIRPDIDAVIFNTTAIHSTIPLIQKLLLRGDVIQSDREIDAKTQIALLIDMELSYIKGSKECVG
ncbi:MAG: hypothetical protein CVU91_01115 [Firmicutes bacterium HGW-Firmicutes-16]|nr:MAG: hypothetical protein CVU91_01115 [Firmicutes bacterium HGW-Firmicutes-16]